VDGVVIILLRAQESRNDEMAQFIRASKYKHVFCDPPRPDATFQNLRLSTVTGDQNYIKANGLYFAVGVQVIKFNLSIFIVLISE